MQYSVPENFVNGVASLSSWLAEKGISFGVSGIYSGSSAAISGVTTVFEGVKWVITVMGSLFNVSTIWVKSFISFLEMASTPLLWVW